ncbi:MAG: hypothetical protein L3K10_04755 [Thermoplasmata archaeon]|nr:hypothetical protein [Thermoplasmata archaeon]
MAANDVASIRVGGGFAHRRLAYRSLAYALAGATPPAGAVFECTADDPIPRILVRPRHLLEDPRNHVAPEGGAISCRLDPRAFEPPSSTWDRLGVLVPAGPAPLPRLVSGGLPVAHPPLSGRHRVGGWAGLQTLWIHPGSGRIHVAVRFRVAARSRADRDRLFDRVGARLLADWERATGIPASIRPLRRWDRRDWRRAGVRSLRQPVWSSLDPETTERTAELGFRDLERDVPGAGGHTVVFGASGTGKTTWLASRAVRAIEAGRGVVVIDLHGDLAPAIIARLTPSARGTVVAVDAGARPVVGISGLAGPEDSVDRIAGHFVAAVKRLSPDGSELAWGFRLERIFDTFSRLVLESGGTLLDLYALLTDPRRREAALFGARSASTVRFLEELGPIVRRNPEFLWSAATRLSKVVLLPELTELLAPPDGGLEVERLVRSGRSLLVRLPVATLGPEAAGFAATLVLGRIYLGLVGSDATPGSRGSVLLILDEVQSFPPRLVSEILSESRKFGVEALVATQYPDRLAPELRGAAAGAAGTFVAFRTPPAATGTVGAWIGLPPSGGAEALARLPVGTALVQDPDSSAPRWLPRMGPLPPVPPAGWGDAVTRTREEFGATGFESGTEPDEEPVDRLLLAILSAEEAGHPLGLSEVVGRAAALPGRPIDPAELERSWVRIRQGPECSFEAGAVRLTVAGERRAGLGAPTGAASESSEHRALLVRAFRVFARHGYSIEIVRQGRFDTTLPDALFRQFGRPGPSAPVDVARTLDRVRSGWAWRCFGGRDVHLEAEVSGALRPERIRRGWQKAEARDAFALFLVGDAARARRVRRTLRTLGLRPGRAQVWTLKP